MLSALSVSPSAGQVCCDGTVIRGRVHGEHTACCGSTLYHDGEQVCCPGDTLRPRVFSTSIDCCVDDGDVDGQVCCVNAARGTVAWYNSATHLCCDGTIQERATSNSTCCGTAVYNRGTHVCCADTAVGTACCGSSAIGGPSAEDVTCCGGSKVYDTAVEICCDDVVRRKVFDDVTACCGTAVYNSTASACCDGAVQCTANDDFDFRCWWLIALTQACQATPRDYRSVSFIMLHNGQLTVTRLWRSAGACDSYTVRCLASDNCMNYWCRFACFKRSWLH